MDKIEKITKNEKILAVLLRKDFDDPGVHFFTPGEFSQQLGMLIHKKGKTVSRHKHKLIKREIFKTQEVLVLLEGKIQVDLFDDDGAKVRSVIMQSGDSVLLASGGHSVEVLEDSKIIEIKQGPYSGSDDKEYY